MYYILYERKKMNIKETFTKSVLLCLLMLLPSVLFGQLTGIKYIGGTAPDYTTIESAIDDLNSNGVGLGGVTFLIRDGTYTENDNLTILDVSASEFSPVIFQPDVGATVIINIDIVGDYSTGLRIHNSDHITINGSAYGSEDESRDMTINGYRNVTDDMFVFWLSNGSDNVTIKNLVINSISTAANTGWSTPVYCSTYGVTSPLVGMDSFTLSNCEVVGGSTYGVFMDGDTGLELTNFYIVGNEIADWQKFGLYLLSDVHDCEIEGNEIYQTFDYARSSVYGISIHTLTSGTLFHHNYIHDLTHSELAGNRGIFLYGGSSNNTFYDNIISLSPGTTANTSYCFYISSSGDGENNLIYYNTLYMGGTDQRGTDSYCMQVCRDLSNHIFKNNILVNERQGDNGNIHAALYIYTNSTFFESDYNFLSVNSDEIGDNRYVARVGTVYYNTLTELQDAPGYAPRDANSLTGNPGFIFPDLHLSSASQCIAQATPVAWITTDIDYDPRDETYPDIGADEYISNHAPVITYFYPDQIAFSITQYTEQSFNIVAIDPDDNPLYYYWYIEDIQQGSSSTEFIHTFADTGNFEVKALVSDGELADSTLWDVTVVSGVAIDDDIQSGEGIQLFQNSPNPFRNSTTISFAYTLNEGITPSEGNIIIYNIKGELVRNLELQSAISETIANLIHVTWDGTGNGGKKIQSGVYLYRLESNDYVSKFRKLVLIW